MRVGVESTQPRRPCTHPGRVTTGTSPWLCVAITKPGVSDAMQRGVLTIRVPAATGKARWPWRARPVLRLRSRGLGPRARPVRSRLATASNVCCDDEGATSGALTIVMMSARSATRALQTIVPGCEELAPGHQLDRHRHLQAYAIV